MNNVHNSPACRVVGRTALPGWGVTMHASTCHNAHNGQPPYICNQHLTMWIRRGHWYEVTALHPPPPFPNVIAYLTAIGMYTPGAGANVHALEIRTFLELEVMTFYLGLAQWARQELQEYDSTNQGVPFLYSLSQFILSAHD
jgi:hypothetical protein